MFKMAGAWLWTCKHGGHLASDQFRAGQWRDPWSAALAGATKHSVCYHDDDPARREELTP